MKITQGNLQEIRIRQQNRKIMKGNNEINKELKEGHWYKNLQTNEPIMIKEDNGYKVKAIRFIAVKPTKDEDAGIYNNCLLLPEEIIIDKKDIVPLEVTEENLLNFGFKLPPKWIYNSDLRISGRTSAKHGSKFYIINKTDKGIHEIQERYNLKLTLRIL